MRASNANFDARLEGEHKQVLYVLEFDGISDKFSNLEFAGTATKAILELPRTNSQKVIPEEGQGGLSSMSFVLQDLGLYATNLVKTYPMRGRKATMKIGFLDLAYSDFLTFFVGTVEKVALSSDYLFYSFEVRDPQVFGKEKLFEPFQTKLTAGVDDSAATFPAVTTGFPDPASFPAFTKFFFACENEICSYTSLDASNFLGVARGQKGTTAAPHVSGKKINEIIVLLDGGVNPINALLQILTSTGTPGTNGSYDILPAHWALGVDQTLINVGGIETARDENVPTLTVEFNLGAREQAQQFIANEFFRSMGAYPIIEGDGKYSVRFFERPVPLATLPVWDERVVREVKNIELNLDQTYNNLVWEYDWDPIAKVFLSREAVQEPDSIAKYGEQPLRVYPSKGIRTVLAPTTFISDRSGVIFFRYAEPPPTLAVENHFASALIEPGDQIFFTHPLPPNPRLGIRGFISATMEVVDRRLDLNRMKVESQIQFISMHKNYFLWGPETLGDAAAEFGTPNWEKYGFWADAAGRLIGATQDGDRWG